MASETQKETVTRLRALLARAYNAAMKPEWEEGECLNEVLSDMRYEGIEVEEQDAEMAKPICECGHSPGKHNRNGCGGYMGYEADEPVRCDCKRGASALDVVGNI